MYEIESNRIYWWLINLVIVYSKHLFNAITEILPVFYLYDWQIYITFSLLFILKLCNPNGWKFYMQFKYINMKIMLKYFVPVF